MNLEFSDVLWISGLLLLVGIVLNKPSKRFGVPGLVLYLSLGIVAGNGGEYDFLYNYPEFTLAYSEFAIGMIIFIGGLETKVKRFRPVLLQAASLSTLGVLTCSLLVGLFGWAFLDLSLLEGWLLGAVISATDASAVFSILESKKLQLKEHLSETLEMESGSNDPMAYFLTITLTGLLTGSGKDWMTIAGEFVLSIVVGLALGAGLGVVGLIVSRKLRLDIKGLYPLILLSIALMVMGVAEYAHANMLLAMYMAGITLGNGHLNYRTYSINFFESISWLMEITLFVILGLQVFPRSMLPYMPLGIAVAFFLMLVARPLSVILSLYPFKVSRRKYAFVSWVGLRGATPIVFSLVPLVARVRHSDLIFNAVFTIVILSVIVQGTTLEWLARQLNLVEK